jgi:hypothetical protein
MGAVPHEIDAAGCSLRVAVGRSATRVRKAASEAAGGDPALALHANGAGEPSQRLRVGRTVPLRCRPDRAFAWPLRRPCDAVTQAAQRQGGRSRKIACPELQQLCCRAKAERRVGVAQRDRGIAVVHGAPACAMGERAAAEPFGPGSRRSSARVSRSSLGAVAMRPAAGSRPGSGSASPSSDEVERRSVAGTSVFQGRAGPGVVSASPSKPRPGGAAAVRGRRRPGAPGAAARNFGGPPRCSGSLPLSPAVQGHMMSVWPSS